MTASPQGEAFSNLLYQLKRKAREPIDSVDRFGRQKIQRDIQYADPEQDEKSDCDESLVLIEFLHPAVGQEDKQDLAAVKRRDRQEVEDRQADIDLDIKDQERSEIIEKVRLIERKAEIVIRREVRDERITAVQDDTSDRRGDDIGYRSHQGGDAHIELRPFEMARIDRDRLCPTDAEQQQRERAEGIDMRHRIEGQSAAILDRSIAELHRREGVRPFVERQHQKDDHQNSEHLRDRRF